MVTKLDTETRQSETRCFLSRHDVFGELGVVNGVNRNASVIVKSQRVELLAFTDEVTPSLVIIIITANSFIFIQKYESKKITTTIAEEMCKNDMSKTCLSE